MDAYTTAFAIGYYYGRAYNNAENVPLHYEDLIHRENQGFTKGLEAGRRDFQEIDLPAIALAQAELDLQR